MRLQNPTFHVPADIGRHQAVQVLGDPVFYGDENVTTAEHEGTVEHGETVVLAHGRTFVSSGVSDLVVADTDADPDVVAPVEKSARKKSAAKK